MELNRFVPVGSDHFAITATFVAKTLEPTEPEPVNNDLKDSKEIIAEGQEDAEENGDKSEEPTP